MAQPTSIVALPPIREELERRRGPWCWRCREAVVSLDRECGSKQGFLAKTDAKHVDQLLSCRQSDAFTSWSRPRDQFIMMAAKLGGRDRDHGGPVTDAVTYNRAHGPLIELIERLKTCTPAQRIDLREPILAYGQAAIRSLVDAAVAQPELSASVSSWLEFVVARNPSARGEVVTGLRSIAQGAEGELAKGALARLGAAEASKLPRSPWDARVDRRRRRPSTPAYGRPRANAGSSCTAISKPAVDTWVCTFFTSARTKQLSVTRPSRRSLSARPPSDRVTAIYPR